MLLSLSAAAWGPSRLASTSNPMMRASSRACSVQMQARPLVEASNDIGKSTRAAFEGVDLNSDNLIDRSEMQSALVDLGLSLASEKTATLFTAFDADKNGAIDYSEFEELLLTASFDPESFTEDEFKAAFDAVDADANGVIDREELQASLDRLSASMDPPLSTETMTELFDAYDEDKNGELDYREYKMLLLASGLPVLLSELLLARYVRNRFSALEF